MKKFNFLENLLRKKFVMSGMSGMSGLRADAVNPDSLPTVNRQSRLMSVQRHYSVTSARVAREWLNGSSRLRVLPLKIVAVLAILLTIGIGDVWGENVTIQVSSDTWTSTGTSGSGGATSVTKNGITVSSTKGYKDGTTAIRDYQNSVITISSSVGNISSIAFTCTASGTSSNGPSKLAENNSSDPGSYSYSGYVGTWSFGSGTSTVSSVTLKATAQCRWTQVVVTYIAAAGPTLTTSSSMTTLTYSGGSPVAQSFTIGGSNLTNTVRVTAPTDYQVSKSSGSGYANYIEFTNTEVNAADKTVYIRLQSGLSAGNIASRNITVTSSGATEKTIAVTGSVPYTITWMANGSTFSTTYVAVGSTLTLPASDPDPATYSCDGKYFYGWYGDASSYSSASVAPSIAAAGAAVSADKTYYAVFADRSGSGAVTWDKVTSAPSDWSGDYVIVESSSANAMISDFHSGTSGEFKSASVTINAAGTQITSTPTDKMIWTFAKNGSNAQYSLRNKSTGTYAQITGTSSTNAALNASAQWFTIETATSGVWDVASVANSARCFAWYATNSSFRTYAKSTNNTGRLFKKSGEGYTYSNYATSCSAPSQCATPTFSVAAGTYNNNQSVGISCGTDGVTIRYTTDGTNPTKTTGTVYSTKISVTGTTTIKAIAYKDGLTDSDVASATFTLVCATPTLSPSAGSYCGDQSVTISCATDGATIRYTTNGNDPTESSTVYSSAISVTSTTTIKAKAFKTNYTASSVASATYTITTLTTMDAIYSAATASETSVCIKFNNWVISGVSTDGKNVYLTDGTKGLIIYNSGGSSGFAVGNILSGTVTCNLKKYNNSAEIVGLTSSATGLIVTTGGTVTPIAVDATAISSLSGINTGSVVTTTGVCSYSSSKYYINGAQIFNQLLSSYTTPTAGITYTCTGVYLQYGDTKEILPLSNLTTFTITAVSNNVSYGTVSLTGSVITVTPESGYRVSTTTAYTVTSGTATVTDNGDGTFTVTPSSDCTVRINFEATPTHNIIFNTGGLVSIANATVCEGDTYNITETPAASLTEDCEYSTFVGWTTVSSIADESVRPSLVTSVEMGVSNVTLYAVYSKTEEGGGSGDYELVEEDLGTDWAGDYLIAYSSTIFADGRVGGKGDGGIGASGTSVDPSTNLSDKVVDATWGDTYYVTIEASETEDKYLLKTQDGKYNYYSSNSSDISATDTKATAEGYPLTITYNTSSDIAITIPAGPVFHYNTSGYFRFYKDGGQEPVYLYKKSSGTRSYSLDANCSSPTIIATPRTLNFEDKGVGGAYTMTFTVRGANLTNNISLAISGTDAAMFSIDKSTLTQSAGSVATTTVTVTYSPTSAGSHSAQVNLTSEGATTKTVTLTGTGKWAVTWMVDGEVYETTLVANGTKPTLPDAPDSFDATSSEFYGWSTAEWKGRIDDLAGKTVYTSSDDMSTVNTSGKTYYAVYAKPDGLPYNTLIWAEDFSGYSADNVPSGSRNNDDTGTTLYGGGSVTYGCTSGDGGTTKIYEETSAGGSSPELMLSKYSGTFTVTGLPKAGASGRILSTSRSFSVAARSATAGTTSFTITCGSDNTFGLTFTGPSGNKNARIDDIELRFTRSATYSRFMTNSREDMYVTSAKDIMTQASMTMNINRSAIKSGSVTIADVAGSQGGAFHAVITNGTANASTGLNATVEIQYTPTKANVSESATMTVTIGAVDSYTFTVYGRSLPEEFAIVGKVGAVWTALPADALSSGLHAGYGLTVDNTDAPTEATLAPEAALYKYYARTTKDADYIRLAGSANNKALWSSSSNGIKVWAAIGGGSATGDSYEWKLATTDNVTYTLWNKAANSGSGRNLGINNDKKWGMHATPATDELRFLPVTSTAEYIGMDVTSWGATSFVFTTGDVIPAYSSITVLYDDDSYSATMSGSGPYTLSIPGIDFTAHSGEQLIVQWKDGSDNPVAQGAVITPIFITSANTNFAGYADLDMLSNCDVLVKNGAMLTITTNNLHVRNLTVEGGSTLNISGSGITFYMNSLSLRGGWTTISGERAYDMPRVYINPASTLSKSQNTVNFDISVNKDNYYPFAVPFPVAVSGVDYARSDLATASIYGTHYVIKTYDGANRATNGPVDKNWTVVGTDQTLQPGKGYILTAVPVGGEAVIRFPMSFTNAWTTNGEKGVVDATTKNVITVTAYSGAAATADKRHAGWNLLGVPYMSCFTSGSAEHSEDDAFITGKMELTGDPADPYGWDEDGDVYVTVPVHDFSEYLQYNIEDDDTKLLPGWCFFVQFAKSGTLTFAPAGQEDSGIDIYAPKRATNESPVVKTGIILSDGNKSDKTTLLISDKYSADEYEINADLEKMFGNGYTLATYSLSRDTRLAYNAMSMSDAKNVIPIGFRAPEDGEYTFSLNPRYAEAAVERVDLIDYLTGEVTNLMMSNYTFTTGRTQDDERFALNVVPIAKVPTGVEDSDVRNQNSDVRKIILDDKMFIIRDGLMYDATGKRVKEINK